MAHTIARLKYTMPGDDYIFPPGTVNKSGRLPELLILAYDEWKRGELEDANISLSYTILDEAITESIFLAMKQIEQRP